MSLAGTTLATRSFPNPELSQAYSTTVAAGGVVTPHTLIVTDYHGQFGAVDIVGIFNHSTAAGHILTLA
jgi:hypothetical protein